MGGRYDLTDFEWSAIEPSLPNKPRGVPRADDRRAPNGILWALRSGAPWRDLRSRFNRMIELAAPRIWLRAAQDAHESTA